MELSFDTPGVVRPPGKRTGTKRDSQVTVGGPVMCCTVLYCVSGGPWRAQVFFWT